MDFVTLLRRDHETVSSLFHQIQGGFDHPDTPERHRLFRQLEVGARSGGGKKIATVDPCLEWRPVWALPGITSSYCSPRGERLSGGSP